MRTMARTALAIALSAASVPAAAAIIENFESGSFGPGWVAVSAAATVDSGGAFEGNFGASNLNSGWFYREDIEFQPNDELSVWIRTGGSSVFALGFNANSGGTIAFGVAQGASKNFCDLFSWSGSSYSGAPSFNFFGRDYCGFPSGWVRLALRFNSKFVDASVYDNGNNTSLSRLAWSGPATFRGISLYGQNTSFDLIQVNSNIPEPNTWILLISGFGLVGATMRRYRIAVG